MRMCDSPKAESWRPPGLGCMRTSNVCGLVTSLTLSLRNSAALKRVKDIPDSRQDGTTCSSFMAQAVCCRLCSH